MSEPTKELVEKLTRSFERFTRRFKLAEAAADADYALFLFNDPAPTAIYTLSLHDALPISYQQEIFRDVRGGSGHTVVIARAGSGKTTTIVEDRKSTRLNSSHGYISYAVFCLKKKMAASTWT